MIEVANVFKSFGAAFAVKDVSFTAPAGAITAFVGPNGAGKSTVLRMIAGLASPDRGRVLVEGKPYAEAADPAGTMGVFLSAESIPDRMTALDYLVYAARLQGRSARDARSALSLVGLDGAERVRVRRMSLGMRQRLGIAVTGLGDPRILLLDEPSNGLDPAGVQWFREYITHQAGKGAAVLLSSHHMAELALVAHRVVMIEAGRIVTEGTVSDFVATEQNPSVFVRAVDTVSLRAALIRHGLRCEELDDGMLVHDVSPQEVGRIAFEESAGLRHLTVRERSIEQTYFERLAPTAGGAE